MLSSFVIYYDVFTVKGNFASFDYICVWGLPQTERNLPSSISYTLGREQAGNLGHCGRQGPAVQYRSGNCMFRKLPQLS